MESEFSFETTNQAKRQTNQPNKEIKKKKHVYSSFTKNARNLIFLKLLGTFPVTSLSSQLTL
jgi:hypothetical protein